MQEGKISWRMALIGKIRKNSWVLVVMIALGLGGFILMDMTSGQQSIFGSSRTIMAEVEGQDIDINEFSNVEQIVYGNSSGDPYARRNALWTYYVENAILHKEADAIGLGVSRDELIDLQFGNNLSPIITTRFQDPNTRQVNREQLNQFRQAIENNSLDASIRPFWAHQEKEIIKERLKEKITNIAAKGLYVPSWQAEMIGNDQNAKVDFVYVHIPFTAIADSEVALSDADYEAYLKEHSSEYKLDEEARKIAYVVFDVKPTAADSAAYRQNILDLVPAFESTTDDSLFVGNNYGTIDAAYLTSEQLPDPILDTIYTMTPGTVYGPYLDQGAYWAVKLLDRKVVPDSVKSRHILLQANPQNPFEVEQATKTVDSLKNLIEAGTHRFDSLAVLFGSDGTASKGGDLGFAGPGQMVKPFNDLIFYEAEPGKLYTVQTQFGVHLVEVMDRKFDSDQVGVQLAFISQTIIPSEETQRDVEDQALNFVESYRSLEALQEAVAARDDLKMTTSSSLRRNDYFIGDLGGGQSSRSIIRWAFGDEPGMDQPDPGDVSPEVYRYQDEVRFFNNKFVLAALKSIQKPGLPKAEAVKEDIEPAVINQKKAALAKERIGSQTDLSAIAGAFTVGIDTARNVTFAGGFIPDVGSEPEVVAHAMQVELNQVSKPIVGNSGVFVVKPIYKPAATATANIPQIRRQTLSSLQSQVRARLMNALRENADIEDNRSRFF